MPVWLWLVIGFAILLAFGALVDYMGKRKRNAYPADTQQDVDEIKAKHENYYR
ncbi:hypothetical protein [Sutcliffiella halmapala]|uniref:hypothetical protein n=1 Tax=Sutcliffiella halmapala TaxID=79882 RepID=UPI00147539F0|nr:hypothetical protein [Sutcliffiella halmapala]